MSYNPYSNQNNGLPADAYRPKYFPDPDGFPAGTHDRHQPLPAGHQYYSAGLHQQRC